MNGLKTRRASAMRGFSLVELMVALVLGLLVVGGATSVFVSNRQTYRTAESLARVQESARIAFELMARDVREAGQIPCGNELPMANVLNQKPEWWWADWDNKVRGFDGAQATPGTSFGTGEGQRVAGTDAIDLKTGVPAGINVVGDMPTSSANIDVIATNGLQKGDIVMICNYEQAAMIEVTQTPSDGKIQHNSGNGTPGNCTKNLGHDKSGAKPCSNAYKGQPFKRDSTVAYLRPSRWFIGYNDDGNKALFRQVRTRNGLANEEISDGVEDMQLTFLSLGGATYQSASAVPAWDNVSAVRVTLTLRSTDKHVATTAANSGKIERTLSHVVGIRSRLP